jgi:hypothetical protein
MEVFVAQKPGQVNLEEEGYNHRLDPCNRFMALVGRSAEEEILVLEAHPFSRQKTKESRVGTQYFMGGEDNSMGIGKVIERQGSGVRCNHREHPMKTEAAMGRINIMTFKERGKSRSKNRPGLATMRVRAAKIVQPCFVRTAAGRRTRRGRPLAEFVLLVLEGQQVVDPFYQKQTLQEWNGKTARMEQLPGDKVIHWSWPAMVTTEVLAVSTEPREGPELRGDVVGNSSGMDGEDGLAGGGEDGGGVQDCDGRVEMLGGDIVAFLVQPSRPTQRLDGVLFVLVAFHVD